MMHHLHPLNFSVLTMNQGTHRLGVEDTFDSETSHFIGPHLSALNILEPSPYGSFPLSSVLEESLTSNDMFSSNLLSPLDYQHLYDLSPTYPRYRETALPLDSEAAHYAGNFHREFFLIGQGQQHQQQELETTKLTMHSGKQNVASLMKDATNMDTAWFSSYDYYPNSGMSTTKIDVKEIAQATPTTHKKGKSKPIKITKNKPNVKKACANCQKSHVACDVERPCRRCVLQGRAEMCFDSEQKQKGRRRLDDSPPKSFLENSSQPPDAGLLHKNSNIWS